MIEFIYHYCKVHETPSIIEMAGVKQKTYNDWRDKKRSPQIKSCILISRAISKKYKLNYDELIIHCLKSVMTYR